MHEPPRRPAPSALDLQYAISHDLITECERRGLVCLDRGDPVLNPKATVCGGVVGFLLLCSISTFFAVVFWEAREFAYATPIAAPADGMMRQIFMLLPLVISGASFIAACRMLFHIIALSVALISPQAKKA